jgi:uncharacterized protein (TIGR03435 family)
MRLLIGIGFSVLLTGTVFAENAEPQPPQPKFDAAAIQSSVRARGFNPPMTGGVLRGDRFDLRRATMLDLIRTAWNVDPERIFGGPDWLEMDQFDIAARAPQGTPDRTLRLMLQNLLEDRFHLQVHEDKRPMPAYVLTAGKSKPKLREASGGGAGACQPEPERSGDGAAAAFVLSCRDTTMDELVQALRRWANDYLTSPVVNSTGIEGAWDFELRWYARPRLPQAGPGALTVFDAVEQQLGLRLDLGKADAPALVVDRVEEKPAGNPPGVDQLLPPTPASEFEVADLKLAAADERPFARSQPSGRVEMRGYTLRMLVNLAWNINQDDMIAGATKGMESQRFTLQAKSSSIAAGPGGTVQTDADDLRLMLQALLKDRFNLKVHNEDRPVAAYTLLAVKPKLIKADPANRPGCRESAAVAKDPRETMPIRSRLLVCRNVTTAQFTEQLERLVPGYIYSPVEDATGIEGRFDITLNFSSAPVYQSAVNQPTGQAAADPNEALSLPEAISRQLGLKLDQRKRMMPVLVIDSFSEKPTEN